MYLDFHFPRIIHIPAANHTRPRIIMYFCPGFSFASNPSLGVILPRHLRAVRCLTETLCAVSSVLPFSPSELVRAPGVFNCLSSSVSAHQALVWQPVLTMWSSVLVPALLATACLGVPYEEYILAPSSRNLVASSVYQVNGSVSNAPGLIQPASNGNVTFHGPASVTLDFGRNVGGIVSFDITSASARDAFVGVTFTESSQYISSQACDARADSGLDSPLWFAVGRRSGRYAAEKKHDRGAFRYLTLVTNTTATVSLRNVRVKYTAAPTQDLRAYKGYFHSNDELLNRIWYAGAYTNQLCTIDPSTGDALPLIGVVNETETITLPDTTPWYNNYTITNGSSTLTDGAKRDRLIWPGDMSIAVESVAVSTGDLYSIHTALEALFAQQQPNGRLPYASLPFPDRVSYTYHLHTLIGVSYYYRLTGDRTWLTRYWDPYKRGVEWALSSVDESGLANITASSDWLRFGMGGHVCSPLPGDRIELTGAEH